MQMRFRTSLLQFAHLHVGPRGSVDSIAKTGRLMISVRQFTMRPYAGNRPFDTQQPLQPRPRAPNPAPMSRKEAGRKPHLRQSYVFISSCKRHRPGSSVRGCTVAAGKISILVERGASLVHLQAHPFLRRFTTWWIGSPGVPWCWDFGSLVCWQGSGRDAT